MTMYFISKNLITIVPAHSNVLYYFRMALIERSDVSEDLLCHSQPPLHTCFLVFLPPAALTL